MLELLHNANDTGQVQSVKTFDFKTMYTSIPHKQLKQRPGNLIDTTFHGCDCKYIVDLSTRRTRWSKQPNPHGNHTTADQLKRDLNYLIDNLYFVAGPHVFQQVVGIPMGTNCAPLLADLFLYTFESKFMRKLTRESIRLARASSHEARYIDDLLVINDEVLEDRLNDIYPSEMVVQRQNESDQACDFLDLSIWIEDDLFRWKLYDKRDSFDFPIRLYPWADSNISRITGHGVYAGQLIRFVRNSTNILDFQARHSTLVQKLIAQGWCRAELMKQARRVWSKHRLIVTKLTNSWRPFASAFNRNFD